MIEPHRLAPCKDTPWYLPAPTLHAVDFALAEEGKPPLTNNDVLSLLDGRFPAGAGVPWDALLPQPVVLERVLSKFSKLFNDPEAAKLNFMLYINQQGQVSPGDHT